MLRNIQEYFEILRDSKEYPGKRRNAWGSLGGSQEYLVTIEGAIIWSPQASIQVSYSRALESIGIQVNSLFYCYPETFINHRLSIFINTYEYQEYLGILLGIRRNAKEQLGTSRKVRKCISILEGLRNTWQCLNMLRDLREYLGIYGDTQECAEVLWNRYECLGAYLGALIHTLKR